MAAVLLLNAGVDPGKWYGWLHQRAHSAARPTTAKTTAPAIPQAALPIQAPTTPTKLPGNDSSVGSARQGLILTGTVLGRNFKEGYAMLGVARENPQTYAAGAVLANGARLTEVHEKYVVLERGGRAARLYLDGGGSRSTARRSTEDVLSVGGAQAPTTPVASSTEPLTEYLRPTPIYDGAVLTGYQVYPGGKASAFAQMGLQPADVITALGGVPLSDPAQAVDEFRELMNGRVLSADVMRKGKSEHLTLDGAILLREQERVQARGVAPAEQMP